MKSFIRSLALALVLLVVVPGVLALSISPSYTNTGDDLTCIGGDPGFAYRWYHTTINDANFLGSGQGLSSASTSMGQTIWCQALLDLGFGEPIPVDSASTLIQNAIPQITTLSFVGLPYYTNSTVNINAVATDADGDSVNLTYVFSNASQVLQNSSTSSYVCTVGSCPKNQNITITVIATDGINSSTGVNSTTILNSIPSAPSLSVAPGSVYIGTLLNASASSTDADGETLNYTYEFYNLNTSTVLQAFSTSNTYNVTIASVRNVIQVTVNVSDSESSVLDYVNVTVLNSVPILTLGNLSFNQDTNLVTNLSLNSSDLDGDVLSFFTVSSANITATLSGDNLTLTPDASFAGTQTVNVTVSDGIVNTTNVIYVTIIDTANPFVNITFPSNGAYYNVSRNVTVNYTITDNSALDSCWYTSGFGNGTLNCSAGTQLFTGVPDGNHTVTIYANDTTNNTASDNINFTVFVNTPPVVSSINLVPVTAYTDSNFTCNFTLTDAEETSLTGYYTWFKDGVANLTGSVAATNATATQTVLNAANTSKGESWLCQITPSDGNFNATAVNSSVVVVLNTDPIGSAIPDQTWAINTNQSIDLTSYFSDLDNENLNFTAPAVQNITIYIDNSTNMVILEPDTGFAGTRIINFTAWDSDNANVTSNTFNLNVGVSVFINSWVNNIFYSGTLFLSNVSGVVTSTVNISNITGPTINVDNSTVTNSIVVDSDLINCIVVDTTIYGMYCLNSYIDPSDIRYSNITGSTIYDSLIWSSNFTNSIANNSNIYNSSIDLSNVTYSNFTNVTMDNSNVINSQLNNTVISSANITDGVLYSGTMLMTNGTVYNATSSGQQNLTGLLNSKPLAVISNPANASSYTNGATVYFNSSSTDINVGGFLNDSITWFWDFGDGSNATTENASHVYSADNTYNVILTVTDSYNETDSDTITLTVSTPTPPSGGGGSSRRETISGGLTIVLANSETRVLSRGSYVIFDFGGVEHRVTLEDILGDLVKIKVESEPQIALLEKNESAKFNLDEDAYLDLEVILKDKTAFTATLQFIMLFEDDPSFKPEVVEEVEEVVDEVVEEEEKVSSWKTFTGKVSEGWDSSTTNVKEFFSGLWSSFKENLLKAITVIVLAVAYLGLLIYWIRTLKTRKKAKKVLKSKKLNGKKTKTAKEAAVARKKRAAIKVKLKGLMIKILEGALRKLKR